MSITVYTYNDKVLKNVANDKWLKKYVDPLNPLDLPPNTMRVKFKSGYTPSPAMTGTKTLVDATNNIWDIYIQQNNRWSYLFENNTNLLEVLSANMSTVTSLNSTFDGCTSLTRVPLFDTSSLTDAAFMFQGCVNVETGALALYQRMITQANPPSVHERTFKNCGSDTVTGAAELAQIPSSWGGTGT